MIINHSYSENYLEEIIEIAEEKDLTFADTFIMSDKNEFSSPKSVDGDDYTIWYIGEFKCSL